jgi:hypothetical protein
LIPRRDKPHGACLVLLVALLGVVSAAMAAGTCGPREAVFDGLAWGDPMARLGGRTVVRETFQLEPGTAFPLSCPQLMVGRLEPNAENVLGLFARASVLYCFFDDQLAYIRVRPGDGAAGVRSMLVSKYGKPAIDGLDAATWAKNDTVIRYDGGWDGQYPSLILYSDQQLSLHSDAWERQRQQESSFG